MNVAAVRITVLIENTASSHGLLAEHGLAYWIDTGSHHIVFDTGQGLNGVLPGNARQLDIPLQSTTHIVLSHGHYDHTGGLQHMLAVAPQATVYAHSAAFRPKYTKGNDSATREIGSQLSENECRNNAAELVWTDKPTEICAGIYVTGEIPRTTSFEDTGGNFFLDQAGHNRDPLLDDQALFFATENGTVILLGCAHAGVINTLQYIRQLTNDAPIHTVMGGMHLVNATPERRAKTLAALKELRIEHLGPAHCTGAVATAEILSEFPNRCFSCHAGVRLIFSKTAHSATMTS